MYTHTLIIVNDRYFAINAFNFNLPKGIILEDYIREKFSDLEDKNCIVIDNSKTYSEYSQFGNTHNRAFNVIQFSTINEIID